MRRIALTAVVTGSALLTVIAGACGASSPAARQSPQPGQWKKVLTVSGTLHPDVYGWTHGKRFQLPHGDVRVSLTKQQRYSPDTGGYAVTLVPLAPAAVREQSLEATAKHRRDGKDWLYTYRITTPVRQGTYRVDIAGTGRYTMTVLLRTT